VIVLTQDIGNRSLRHEQLRDHPRIARIPSRAALRPEPGRLRGFRPGCLRRGIERAVQQVGWGPLAVAFTAADWFEGLKQVAAAVAAILLVAIFNRRGVFLMVWGALSGAAYQLIDMLVHRPRPEAALVHVIRHTNGWSFPSGHLVFFTWIIAYLLLILGRPHLPRPVFIAGWVLQGIVLAIIAAGRIYTGEHWPSDVLAGLLLGAGWTLLGLSIRPLSDPVLRTRNA